MLERLDEVVWPREPDIVSPEYPTLSAEIITKILLTGTRNEDHSFSPEDKLLALAAGQAYPELTIAENLGIKPSNITLVDRHFSPRARARFQKDYPDVTTIESGMFSFLGNPPVTDFSIVTLIGVEHAFFDQMAISTLITLLPNALQKDGVAIVFPFMGDNPKQEWLSQGFQPLLTWTTDNILAYRYSGRDLQK